MKRAVFFAWMLLCAALPAIAQVDSLAAPVDTTVVAPAADTTAVQAPPPADTTAVQAIPPVDSAATRATPTVDATETVRRMETRRQTALVAADLKTLTEIIAEDATYVHANGLMQTRAELFAMLERGDMRYLSFILEDVRYRLYGGTVVGTGVQRIDVKSAGKSMVLRSRYTVVYAVSAAGAKLVAYQSTPTPKMSTRP